MDIEKRLKILIPIVTEEHRQSAHSAMEEAANEIARLRSQNVTPAHAALCLAVPVMRADLQLWIECGSKVGDRDSDGNWRPRLETLESTFRRIANPILKAIRSAEAEIGPQPGDSPAWLNEIISGEREL